MLQTAQRRADVAYLARNAYEVGGLVQRALEHELIGRDQAEALLAEHGPAALPLLTSRVHERLDLWSSQYVADLGLPDQPKAVSQMNVHANAHNDNRVDVVADFYDVADASSLASCSGSVRRRLINALRKMQLPVVFAAELFGISMGPWADIASMLQNLKCLNPSTSQLHKVWKKSAEYYEHEVDEEDGEVVIYGVGTFEEFERMSRRYLESSQRLYGRRAASNSVSERRWRDVARKLERIAPEVAAWEFHKHSEPADFMPIENCYVISTGENDDVLIGNHMDQFSGYEEMPGISFGMDDAGLMRAAVFAKLSAGVFHLIQNEANAR